MLKMLGLRKELPGDDPGAALFLTARGAERAAQEYLRRAKLDGRATFRAIASTTRQGTQRGWRAVVCPPGERAFALTTYQAH